MEDRLEGMLTSTGGFKDDQPVSSPDVQQCWLCDGVKMRRTYLHDGIAPRHSYRCSRCDFPGEEQIQSD